MAVIITGNTIVNSGRADFTNEWMINTVATIVRDNRGYMSFPKNIPNIMVTLMRARYIAQDVQALESTGAAPMAGYTEEGLKATIVPEVRLEVFRAVFAQGMFNVPNPDTTDKIIVDLEEVLATDEDMLRTKYGLFLIKSL